VASLPTPPLGKVQYEARWLGVDPLRCACGEEYELIAEIHDRVVIRAILASMNLPTDPLPIRQARPPPDDDALDWAA